MEIANFQDIKKIFKKVKTPIFGASVYAFLRLGPENFIENYKLLSLYNSKETDLIKKDLPVFCLEEKIKKRPRPRNSSSLLYHQETKKYVKKETKGKKPLILIYKSSKRIKKIVKENNWQVAIAPSFFGKRLLEDKTKFRRILKKIKIEMPPGRIAPLSFLNYHKLKEMKKKFGFPFVIQHPGKGGGKGTFFIKNEKSFNTAKQYLRRQKAKDIVIAKFIKGPSPSIVGCVTRYGILSTRLQYQICDEPLLNKKPRRGGLFCGHDWSSAIFSKNILGQAKEAVDKVGSYFKKIGYRGIFGLDFVLDKKTEKLYVVECNPRLVASFPVLTMIQIENGEMPIIAFHLLEFLRTPYKINIKKINSQMWQKKEGSQMFLHNPFQKRAIQKKGIEAGIYKKSKSKNIKFIREGYQFSQLKNKNEFLFTDGIQKEGSEFKGYQRIRILSKKSIIGEGRRRVDDKTRDFLKIIIKNIKKSLRIIN